MSGIAAETGLGLRLARRAGWSRMAAVVGCSALGVALLLLCLDFPAVAHDFTNMTRDDLLYQLLTAAVALPVIVLVASTSRLSADTRDRRLALLRLVGVSPLRCGLVAAVETGLLVLAGGVIGMAVHLAVRHSVWSALLRRGVGRQQPGSAWVRDIVAVVLIALAVSVVAARPAARAGSGLLAARRVRPHGWGTRLLAAAGCVGFVVAGVLAAWPTPQNEYGAGGEAWRVIAMGIALVGLTAGLVALTQTVLAGLARCLRGRSSGAALVTAGRLDGDRPAIGRAVAGLTIATFVAAFGLSIFTIFTTTPQYRTAQWWLTHEQVNLVSSDEGSLIDPVTGKPMSRAQLAASPGITKVEDAGRYDAKDMATSSFAQAVSLSCDEVRSIGSVARCSDTEPWVADVDSANGGGTEHPATRGEFMLGTGKPTTVTAAFVSRVTTNSPVGGNGSMILQQGAVMVLPPAWLAARHVPLNDYLVTAAPGARDPLGPGSSFVWSDYDQVETYRQITYLLIGVVMSIGLLTVVVTTLDMLAERRRRVAGLRMVGIPVALLRRSQFGAVLAPLGVGLVCAVVAGVLMGRAYLNFGGEAQATPWTALTVLLVSTLVGAVLLAGATTAGLGRPLTADMLRRE